MCIRDRLIIRLNIILKAEIPLVGFRLGCFGDFQLFQLSAAALGHFGGGSAHQVAVNIIPVSYTHLDVYKRQLLDFNAAERAAVGITLEHDGMPNGPEALETYHQINRQLWDSLAKGELNRSKLFAVRLAA